MKLSDHDLRQIDAEYLAHLSPEELLAVSVRLLVDLKEARDRANQTPHNSSRPPGSFAPWEGSAAGADTAEPASSQRRTPNQRRKGRRPAPPRRVTRANNRAVRGRAAR